MPSLHEMHSAVITYKKIKHFIFLIHQKPETICNRMTPAATRHRKQLPSYHGNENVLIGGTNRHRWNTCNHLFGDTYHKTCFQNHFLICQHTNTHKDTLSRLVGWLPVSFLLHVKYTLSYRIVLRNNANYSIHLIKTWSP